MNKAFHGQRGIWRDSVSVSSSHLNMGWVNRKEIQTEAIRMKDYFEGWKERTEIYLPPIESSGFLENIIIRQPVIPIREQRQKKDDEATVLVSSQVKHHAVIIRLKTDEEVEITKNNFVIGKSSEADYTVADNPTVSRQHARIVKKDDEYILEDMNSSNYTFVDGKKITTPVLLTDKERFRLSEDEEFEFVIRVDGEYGS